MVHFSRITEITLSNFKNVEYGKVGKLEFSQGKASLLGIYGQNGSGKTALVEACLLLKYLMSGQAVPDSFVHAITADKEYSELVFSFVFSFDDINAPVYISYSFKIDAQRKMSADEIENCYQIRVFDEIIKVTCLAIPEFFSKTKLIDTSKRDSYGPLSLLNELSRGPQNTIDELKKSKFLAQDNSLSSIFNTRAMEFFKKNSNGFLNRVLEELKILHCVSYL